MNDQQTAANGQAAAMVLENEAYKLAMKSLREQVIQQWKDCPVRDAEGQLLLLQLAKLSDKFESMLSGMVEAGKFAQNKIQLDDLRSESRKERTLRRVFG